MSQWQQTTLGEISSIIMGQAPPGKECNKKGIGTTFVKAGEFGEQYPVAREWTTKPLKMAFPGDVLICVVGATSGKLNLAIECAIGRSVAAIRPNEKLVSSYLYYFMNLLVLSLRDSSTGSAQGIITKEKLENIPFQLPSLSEQERIVAVLDEAFEAINTAIANTEKNLLNTEELFQSILDQQFNDLDSGESGWGKFTIGEFADVRGGKRLPKGQKLISQKTKYPYITISDFNENGSIDESGIRYITKEIHDQISSYTISSSDVFISIAGTIGRSGVIPSSLEGANLTENACKLVLHENFNTRFVYYLTRASLFKDQAKAGTRTTAQPKLALSRIKSIEVYIPELTDQERIVSVLDEASDSVQGLRDGLLSKLAGLEELKQSVLEKAFSGELTDPVLEEAGV